MRDIKLLCKNITNVIRLHYTILSIYYIIHTLCFVKKIGLSCKKIEKRVHGNVLSLLGVVGLIYAGVILKPSFL